MARKLIDQEEAARMLGITPEQVSVLRDRKKLFPYRDGDQWKFKQEDIERYREELQAEQGSVSEDTAEASVWDSGAGDDLKDIDLQVNEEIDSILLSEVELGKSSMEGASTIIGKPGEGAGEDMDLPMAGETKDKDKEKESDDADVLIPLDDDLDNLLASGGSMVRMSESGLKLPAGSPGDSKNVLSGNSALLKSGSTQSHEAGSSGLDLMGDSALARFGEVKLVPSTEDKKSGGSSDKLFGSDALQLSDDELKLMEVGPSSDVAPKPAEGSKKTSGSSIKLGDEELEVVMGGSKSGSGSDLTQSPSDSGIQLISSSDSGLSLDQPLALGSSARRLLDIPTEGAGTVEEIAAEEPAELKPDEDFLLTAMDDTAGEESSDSGSQVIALDTDDEMSSGMFAPTGSGAGLLEEEPSVGGGMVGGASPLMGTGSPFTDAGLMAGAAPTAPREAGYSGANIFLLSVCVVMLMFCGMMTFDLMRNMWSWDGPYPVNSSIMDSIGKLGFFDK